MRRPELPIPSVPSVGSLVLAVSGWIAVALTAELGALSPLRVLAVLVGTLLLPGVALLRVLRPSSDSTMERLLLTLVVSVSLLVLVSTSLMLVHHFTAMRVLGLLAGLTTVLALLPARRVESDSGPSSPVGPDRPGSPNGTSSPSPVPATR